MKASHEHIVFLDHIRGVAILSVFLYHALDASFGADHFLFKGWLRSAESSGALPILLYPLTMGWLGVAIFFVISGFCIHLSHRQSSNRKTSAFLTKRFFRIYPPYLIALLIFAFLFPPTWLNFHASFHASLAQLWSHVFMIHNLDYRYYWGINGVFWSVAVEAQLYLIYPLLLRGVEKWGWTKILWITASIEIGMRILLGIFAHNYSLIPYIAGIPFLYWYSWTMGAAMAEAYVMKEPLPFSQYPLFFWPGLTLIAYVVKPLYPFTFLFAALSTVCFIGYSLKLPPTTFSQPKYGKGLLEHLRFVGLISYSVYLIHQPLINAIPAILRTLFPGFLFSGPLTMLACLASWRIICLLACLFYRFIELPSISCGKWAMQTIWNKSAISPDGESIILASPNLPALQSGNDNLAK